MYEMTFLNEKNQSSASIALFLPTLTPGGIETCMLNLAEGFVQQNITVDLIVADYRGDFITKVPDEVSIIDLEVDRVLKSIIPLRQYLVNSKPNVLLSGHTHANIAAIIAGKMSNTKTTVAIGVHNTHSLSTSTSRSIKSKFEKRLYSYMYTYADEIIAVSEGAKQYTVHHTPLTDRDISIIYNPVITDDLYEEITKPVDHRWLSDESLEVVLGAGRLVEQKDFETLLCAFKIVVRDNNQARLLIAGEGPKENELQQMISNHGINDRVELLGYIDDLCAYMNAADVFVLSSKSEGFGIVLVEALAVGTPVISTDCPHGPNEILENGEYGELVAVGDTDAMADAIKGSLSTKNNPTKIKKRSEEFSVSTISEEYAKVLSLK